MRPCPGPRRDVSSALRWRSPLSRRPRRTARPIRRLARLLVHEHRARGGPRRTRRCSAARHATSTCSRRPAPASRCIDYDDDGWLDLFFVNGSTLEGFPPGSAPTNHLYRNTRRRHVRGRDRAGGARARAAGDRARASATTTTTATTICSSPTGARTTCIATTATARFDDVTRAAGLAQHARALGHRLRLPRLRPRRPPRSLRRQLHRSRSRDRADARVRACAATRVCRWRAGRPACTGGKNVLYHNRGDGTFEDVSEQVGHHARQRHLRPRRQHARLRQRRLGRRLRRQRFESERALPQQPRRHVHRHRRARPAAPTARTASRRPAWASPIGDYDRNGTMDIFKTNFAGDTSTLYANSGEGLCEDRTFAGGHRHQHAMARVGRRRSSISTTTAGSICSSPTATSIPRCGS